MGVSPRPGSHEDRVSQARRGGSEALIFVLLLDEFLERQRAADALLPAEMFERPFECFRRVTL